MQQIVECVPNFSNGRDPEIINAIVKAVASAENAQVINVSSDADHNRTVVTIIGSPAGVEEAAFRGIAKAKELINLDEHTGAHPRIGATDVCPFIPVRGVTSGDCKAIAYRLGERVGRDLDVTVYYYGLAAKKASRKALPDIRKGQYEGWKAEIGHKPTRTPDEGPAKPAPWGATVIGVRQFMVAYNIYLNTDRVEIADAIGQAVRNLSGGFRYVQAKGFLVDGKAQVSMNFHHLERSPLHRVQEAVRREAARYGCAITHSELIGLIPQQALTDAAQWYLQIDDLQADQIVEYHLQNTPSPDQSLTDFVAQTASSTPTPGGGSIAALAGALGAALAQMVAGLTVGRRKYKNVQADSAEILATSQQLKNRLLELVDEDAASFDALMVVVRNKLLSAEEKAAQMEAATIHAAEIPLQTARLCRDVARLASKIAAIGNQNAATDAAAAAFMAEAGAKAAGLNVRTNAVTVNDRGLVASWLAELDSLEGEVSALARETAQTAARRAGF
ncbi:MAG TPA: glutamate formimidoyltransferase [Anaerolineae bacterium]|nr:glutamate formimidoyltransferase [Anaerolineae bacterium]